MMASRLMNEKAAASGSQISSTGNSEMPSSMFSNMISGISSNMSQRSKIGAPYGPVSFVKTGGNHSSAQTSSATTGAASSSTFMKKAVSPEEPQEEKGRRKLHNDSDAAIEGLMLMKSAKIPQGDGEGVSFFEPPLKRLRK